MRPRNPRDDQQLLRKFDLEVSSLKRLSHQHLVSMIGSYTDQKSVAYLMEPVGECNLYTYLCQPRDFIQQRLPSLRNYFGCLANAVAYLHRQRVRHRDLKPQNILVWHHNVFITDFGTALDWSARGRDTTNDPSTPVTEQYMAPEFARRSGFSRSSASDIWSLGVVFLDMLSVLRGYALRELRGFLETHGTGHPYVWNNTSAVTNQWFKKLRENDAGPESDNEPLIWIKDMLQFSPNNRPLSGALTRQIRSAASFIGHCCKTDNDFEDYAYSPSSTHSEEDTDLLLDDMPPELELGEKPFGSLIEASRQSSIERWLGVDSIQSEYIPDAAVEPPEIFEGDPVDMPYDIVEDSSTLTTIIPGPDSITSEGTNIGVLKTLETCDGYDIVQEDSDDEMIPGSEAYGYEVTEDSSGSEATIRQISVQTATLDSHDTPGTNTAMDRSGRIEMMSSIDIQEVENQLDTLEDHIYDNVQHDITGQPLTSHGLGSLNATNFAQELEPTDSRLQREQKRLQKEQRKEKKAKMARMLREEPQISPSVYMQEAWEAASSAATSVMSERTRKTIGGFGSGLAWQDRTAHILEKYVKLGKAAAVRELLQAGCNPGTREKPRIRPLVLGVKGGSQRHNKCVAALLLAGADVNARGSSGRTALHYAIEHQAFPGYTNLIRDLLEAGADPNKKAKSGDFPLLQILDGGYEPLEKHKRDALACLLQTPFATDVNIVHPGTQETPLHLAVRRKDPWAVSMLLTRGAHINKPNGSGFTPLMLAANGWNMNISPGQNKVLHFLLDGGAKVNECNEFGKTALHSAASNLCERAVGLLLEKGADPNIKDHEGILASHYAGDPPYKIEKAPVVYAAIMEMLSDTTTNTS